VEEINLYDLLKYYARKWRFILATTLLGLAIGVAYTNFIQTPLYKSEATLFLINEAGTQGPQDETLINNYVELFESRRVLSPVIEEQGIDMTYPEIEGAVTATAEKDTDVIKVAITTVDPKQSQDFINAAITSFKSQAEELYGADKVQIVDEASLSERPDNVQPMLQLGLATAAGFILAIIVLFFVYDFRLSRSHNEDNATAPIRDAPAKEPTPPVTADPVDEAPSVIEESEPDTGPADKTPKEDIHVAIAPDTVPMQESTPEPAPSQTPKPQRRSIPITRGITRLLVGSSHAQREIPKSPAANPTHEPETILDIDPKLEAQLDDTIYGAPDFDKDSPEDINPEDLPMPPNLDTADTDTSTPDSEQTTETEDEDVKDARPDGKSKTDMKYEPTTRSDSSDSDEY